MPRYKSDDITSKLADDVARLNTWMVGVIIVLGISFAAVFVGVGAILTDLSAEKKAINLDLRDQVKSQNDKIEVLTKQIETLTTSIQNGQKTD